MIVFDKVVKKIGSNLILNDLSFAVEKGDFCILKGKNGSGKTTTINLILGYLKTNKSDKGIIEKKYKSYSYFPEKFNLPSLINSLEFLKIILKDEIPQKTIEDFFYKYKIKNKRICNLSKGMKQKIILIKTLLEDSDLYIFDEPLNGLDDFSRDLFIKDLSKLKRAKKTILISTHEPDFFFKISNKIIELNGDKKE